MLIGPGAVQDGPKIVLVRSFFRLVVCVRFFNPLKLLLGSLWRALGGHLWLLGAIWGPKVTKEIEKHVFSIDFDVVFDALFDASCVDQFARIESAKCIVLIASRASGDLAIASHVGKR